MWAIFCIDQFRDRDRQRKNKKERGGQRDKKQAHDSDRGGMEVWEGEVQMLMLLLVQLVLPVAITLS